MDTSNTGKSSCYMYVTNLCLIKLKEMLNTLKVGTVIIIITVPNMISISIIFKSINLFISFFGQTLMETEGVNF